MKRLFMIMATLLATQAFAGEAQPVGEDPQIERRLNVLAEDLRCLVCQNESLAGSHAELAEDLRREIRDQMKQGKDDKQVVEYLVARYGDFVLYKPPFKPLTLVLWLGPLFFLLVGGMVWWTVLKRRRAQPEGVANTQARAEAARILEGKAE